MKKIVGILAAAALASSAFAEINVSSWGRMDVIPLNFTGLGDSDNQVKSLAGANWDGNNTGNQLGKDGVSFGGSTENAGMALDIAYNSNGLGVGDNANLWVKPVDMLKFTFGKVDYNNGRQDFAYGTFGHTYRLQGMDVGEGLAVGGRGVTGFVVNVNPIDNLWFDYAASVKNDEAYKTLWSDASFGVGYNIPDVANIRAVVIGKDGANQKTEDGKNVGTHAVIQAAVDFTAVENLFITAGVSVPTTFGKAYTDKSTAAKAATKAYKRSKDATPATPDVYTETGSVDSEGKYTYTKTDGTAAGNLYVRDYDNDTKAVDAVTAYDQEVIRASFGVSYKLDSVTFNALFDSKIGVLSGKNAKGEFNNDGFGYLVGLGVDVNFTDSLALITDVRFTNDVYQGVNGWDKLDATYTRGKFGGYVGLCQALTNGFFDFGVEFGVNKAVVQASDNSFTVAIPLQIQVGL